MDADRFDTLTRSLTAQPSRRTILGLGVGGLLAALPAAFAVPDVEAGKRRRKRRKRKKRGGGGPTCTPACREGREKCVNGECCLRSGQTCGGFGDPICCPGTTCTIDGCQPA